MKMTSEQAANVAIAIFLNENMAVKNMTVSAVRQLSDSQIAGYLIDNGHDDTKTNIAKVREAAK